MRLGPLIDAATARRVAVHAALLGDHQLRADAEGILAIARHFGGIQIDPTRTVERTQYLVLWSRLGTFDRGLLDRLLAERRLIEWNAFIVSLDRLPEILYIARRWPSASGNWVQRVRDFLAANEEFRRSIIEQLRDRGPLQSRQVDDSKVAADWQSTGWTHGKSTAQMLEFMSVRGEVFVAGRVGQERLWDLPERVIPPDAPRDELSDEEYEQRRVMRAMRRFGVATLREIRLRAYGLSVTSAKALLARLVEEGRVEPVRLALAEGEVEAFALAGAADGEWKATRTTLLSPFDPLVYDRQRTERLFGFQYRLEMYVPRAKRQFGHFSLPILHRERMVGRLESERDRKTGELNVHRIHWQTEPSAATRRAVDHAIANLTAFVGGG
jgi:uncharacterized protein